MQIQTSYWLNQSCKRHVPFNLRPLQLFAETFPDLRLCNFVMLRWIEQDSLFAA